VRPRRADRLAERVFAKSDGKLQSLDLSPKNDLVVVVFENSARSAMSLRFGTTDDFIHGRDTERVLTGIDPGVIRARIVADGSAVDLLCVGGSLYRVNLATGRPVALLSLSEPLTDLAVGPTRCTELLLAQSGARPLKCIFRGSNA